MPETALIAFATFFATIGPPDVAIIFATLTLHNSAAERVRLAFRSTLIATMILLFFAFLGEALLAYLGISMAAMRTAGGFLLLLIATDMVFARQTGGTSTTAEEQAEASRRTDITVFPMATPLIAGPGAIGAAILLTAQAEGDPAETALVIGALGAVLAIVFVFMLIASRIQNVMGVTGVHVITRVLGLLLAAMAVQFLFDGIRESGLLG
ncbi:MAG: MarC family protein [Pseudomonadota bacterium]